VSGSKRSRDGDHDKTIELTHSAIASLDKLRQQQTEVQPRLVAIAGPALGKYFDLGEETIIGRSSEAQVVIVDDGISRQHAKIEHRGADHVLYDLGSTNGVFVNGKRVQKQVLVDGDRIRCGSTTVLKFSLQDALEENFQKQMYDSAVRDPLTGVYNKRHFQDSMTTEFAFHSRHDTELSVVMIDVDHFKRVNDTHGHLAGDYVLKIVAKVIGHSLRTEDILCRYGGEEFGVILRSTGAEQALVVAERIRKAVAAQAFEFEDKKIPVTASLGVSTLRKANFPSAQALVRAADEYLYAAKQAGRDRTMTAATAKKIRS
jgi:two-component system, cell cycle response regulator